MKITLQKTNTPKQKMKKILIITWVILSCITSAETLAQTTQDPDLKLSLEELKKKYPISLLDEKKKHYKEGQKINIDDYSNAEIKAAFVNADKNFVSRKKIEYKTKSGMTSFNFEITVKNQQEAEIILATCEGLMRMEKNWPNLNDRWQDIMYSIFENQKTYQIIEFLPQKANSCVSNLVTLRGA